MEQHSRPRASDHRNADTQHLLREALAQFGGWRSDLATLSARAGRTLSDADRQTMLGRCNAIGAELLSVPLTNGGARLLYRTGSATLLPLIPALQRAILADLTLPLERHRLAALVQSIGERARLTGRSTRHTPTEGRAI